MAKRFVLRFYVVRLLVLTGSFGVGTLPAFAGQNGFGDVMSATSYFPIRNLAAFGTDDDTQALIASAAPDMVSPADAAAMSAITPAAGDAALHGELYGPFQPGKEPRTFTP